MSSFSGLSVALSALQAHRKSMDVINQNITNANTAGYTRQRANLESLGPIVSGNLHGEPRKTGDGVKVADIARLMDNFALARVRGHEANTAYYKSLESALNEIEVRFNEPGPEGLSNEMRTFFDSWNKLAQRPSSEDARTAVMTSGREIAAQIRTTYSDVATQWKQTKDKLTSGISDINTTLASVAAYNKDVKLGVFIGVPTAELQDRRDALLTKLSALAGAGIEYKDDGTVDVSIAGQQMVTGQDAGTLSIASGPADLAAAKGGTAFSFSATPPGGGAGAIVPLTTGTVGGLTRMLHKSATSPGDPPTIADVALEYDKVASAMRDQVNALHSSGFGTNGTTGLAFFGGAGASDLTVTVPDIASIAASSAAGEVDDNTKADGIFKLATKEGGPLDAWTKFIVDTGIKTNGVQARVDASTRQLGDSKEQLQSQAGVDLDEEFANLLAFQRAYEGAARVMTAVDQALDVLINRTGLVGR